MFKKSEVRSQKSEVRKIVLTFASFLLLIIVICLSSKISYAEENQRDKNVPPIHDTYPDRRGFPTPPEGFSSEIMSRLQATYSGIKDFTISFMQRSSIKGFGEKVFEGKLYIKKPKMIRWDYSKPAKQNIYINGKTAILYIPDQKQAIKQDLSRHPDAEPALGLLSNIEKWQDIFLIKGETSTGDRFRINLTPKNMLTVEKVLVEIDKETFLINKLTIFEKGGEKSGENAGNKVSFNFSNINTNSGLKDKLFEFKIPKGVEVLEY